MSTVATSRWQKIAYGLIALPLSLAAMPLFVYLPKYYASSTPLSLMAIGVCLLLMRLFDFISDPLVGLMDDRLSSRSSFRSIVMVLGALLSALASYRLLLPPESVTAYFFVAYGVLAFLGWSLLSICYYAWGAELSDDYRERTAIVAYREMFGVAGTLIALALPLWVYGPPWDAEESASVGRELMQVYAGIVLVLTPLLTLLAVLSVPATGSSRPVAIRAVLGELFSAPGFNRLLLAFFLNGIANALPASLFLFYGESVLRANMPILYGCLLLYFFAAIAAFPLWVRCSSRYGKVVIWRLSILLSILGFSLVMPLGQGDVQWFVIICFATGLCLGADLILPASMQADIIGRRKQRSGVSASGLTFSVWGMAQKMSLVLAVAIAFPLLSVVGFDASQAEQAGSADAMLRLLYCGIPVLLKLLVWWVLRCLPDAREGALSAMKIQPQQEKIDACNNQNFIYRGDGVADGV